MLKLPLPFVELTLGLRDALAPARCIGCAREGTWYCAMCRATAPPRRLSCIVCKEERPRGTTCVSCRNETPLSGVVSVGTYNNQYLQRGIEWLKFKGIRPLANILGALLLPHIATIAPIEVLARSALLVPLPLHPGRLRTRGFNQSEDIAVSIGRVCGIQVGNMLQRTSATPSQAHLPHHLRTHNMHDAFSLAISGSECIRLIQKKPIIIIVDDVATSGATLASAAAALPKVPHVEIWGAVIARG